MLKKINLKVQDSNTIIEYSNLFMNACYYYNLQKSNISDIFNQFELNALKYENAYFLLNPSELTLKLVEVDKKRDKLIDSIILFANIFSRNFDFAISDAAKQILNSLKEYGDDISNLTFHNETIVLNDIVDKIENNPILKKAYETLGFMPIIKDMSMFNNEFYRIYNIKNSENLKLSDEVLLKTKEELIISFENLVSEINNLSMNQVDEFKKMVKKINELTSEF